MLELPASLTLKRAPQDEAALLAQARAWLDKDERSPGIHATDLLDLRLAYWSRKKPAELPDRLVTMFLVGKVLHSFVISAATGNVTSASDAGGYVDTDLGITFSPDILANGRVIELKTSRQFYEPKSLDDVGVYLEQLCVYMAATKTSDSKLWVLFLNLRDPETKKTSPVFRCYDVKLSAADLTRLIDQLTTLRVNLEEALEANDHRGLPLCREFKCGESNCQWWKDCKPPGRYHEETT